MGHSPAGKFRKKFLTKCVQDIDSNPRGWVYINIDKKLQEQRKYIKYSQEYVAEKKGVTRPTISNWENSKTILDIANIMKLSIIYGGTVDELLKEDLLNMTQSFKTSTYNTKTPLKLDTDKSKIFPSGVEVKANVNIETGEVKFYIEQKDLPKLKNE